MLEFTSNATHMQQVCNKDYDMYRTFSEQSGNVLFILRVSTSGATDSEYVEMILVSRDKLINVTYENEQMFAKVLAIVQINEYNRV